MSSLNKLDEVLHTHVVTPRGILNEMFKDPQKFAQFQGLVYGNVMTVRHDYGQFTLDYEEVQDLLVLYRMRGHL